MNSRVVTAGGFDKVIFESVIDTLAGGASLDISGFTNSDGIIPAGTFIGPKDGTTGLHPIVVGTGDGTPGAVIGISHASVPLVTSGGNNVVGVVLEGVVRLDALPGAPLDVDDIAAYKTALPKITFI